MSEFVNVQNGTKLDESKITKDNALLKVRPDLFREWDFEKNDELGLDIYKVSKSSAKLYWWKCPKCLSPYDMSADKRTRNRNCPYCAGKRVNHTNSLAALQPEIALQWHSTLNKGVTPHDVTSNNIRVFWWQCFECKSPYDMEISHRRKSGCPYCGGKRVNHTNSLASLFPKLASEWHPTLNGNLTPNDITRSSNKEVWWQCIEHPQHVWKVMVYSRTDLNTNCPYCSNQKVLRGYNDLWTTNPELAKQLANLEDGYKYTVGNSRKKLDWICPHCGEIVKSKTIGNISRSGLICDICNDKFSLGEKIVYFLLKSNNIEFIYDQSLLWSKSKRYDFHLPIHNIIIEVHGKQHYEETSRGRSLKEEQENDKFKLSLALTNGVENYVVIDARESSFDWIMNSIKNSELKQILGLSEEQIENFDFDEKRSFVRDSWDLWNSGIKSTEDISAILSISRSTIRRFLKMGYSIGKCDYQAKGGYEYTKRGVIKLTIDGRKIGEYESISDAKRKNDYLNDGGIVRACQGRTPTYDGFTWMYKDDYEILLATGTVRKKYVPSTFKREKSVVKLSEELELIERYDSVQQAARENNLKSPCHISSCCKGKKNRAGGFKWMYKDDYEKMIHGN